MHSTASGAGIDLLAVDLFLADLAAVADRLVADGFDRGPEGVLQVLADLVGVLVRAVVQGVDQAGAGFGSQGLAVEEGRHHLQSGSLAPPQQLFEIEAQQALLRPLAAVGQDPLLVAQDEHEAGRVLDLEGVGDQLLHGAVVDLPRIEGGGQVWHQFVLLRQEILRQHATLGGSGGRGRRGGEQPQEGLSVAAVVGAQEREGAGLDVAVQRAHLVAERGQQAERHPGDGFNPSRGGAQPGEALLVAEEVLLELGELAPRQGGLPFLGCFPPAVQVRADVAVEDRLQIVVRIELVDVLDADHDAVPTSTATTWRKGLSAVVMASRIHTW